MSTYENSLRTTLQEIIAKNPHLANFTIICKNGKEFKTHKLLLASRSKYFEAMFRQEPQKSSVKLDFEDQILEIILKSLVSSNLDGFKMEQLIQLLEVSDYLQMEDFTSEVGNSVAKQLNPENIYHIFELSDLFLSLSSPLGEKCAPYVRENLYHIDHEKIPISWFRLLPKFANSCHVKDFHGRYLDPIQSELILAVILHGTHNNDPKEDWDFPMRSKRKICFGLYDLILTEIFQKCSLLNENQFNMFTAGLYYDKSLRYALPYNNLLTDELVLHSNILKEKYYRPDDFLIESGPCEGCSSRNKPHYQFTDPMGLNDPTMKPHKECHNSIICDGCGMRPVTEKRYKCVVCPDYDLCQICMEKGIRTDPCHSDHEMVRRYSNDIIRSYKGKFSTKLLSSRSYGCGMRPVTEKRYSQYSCAITDQWNVEGPFRKIGIKLSDDSQIVQGLRIELVDGSVRSFGIGSNYDDEIDNIVDLEVPKGQHIRDVNLRSGAYIDQIGFTTNENIQLGPIGGPGGSPSNLKVMPNKIIANSIKQVYLHSIQGVTFGYDIFGRQVGTLCIANLKFIFAVIPCDDESQKTNIHERRVKDIRSLFNDDSDDYASWDNDSSDDDD